MQQLDIFADSRDVALRNDVVEYLQRRNAAAARTALKQLQDEYADDSALPAMAQLVHELEKRTAQPLANHADLKVARTHIKLEVMPAALRVLPASAVQAWLVSC